MTHNPEQAAYDDLTPAQQELHDAARAHSAWNGRNLRDVLIGFEATPVDKAAVAEVFGGPGAGAEFLNGTAQ